MTQGLEQQSQTVANERNGWNDAVHQLLAYDVELALSPAEEGTIIRTRFAGFERSLLVNPSQQVRLVIIDDDDCQQQLGIAKSSAVCLAVLEGSYVAICSLQITPKVVPTVLYFSEKGKPANGNGPDHTIIDTIVQSRLTNGNGFFHQVTITDEEASLLGVPHMSGEHTAQVMEDGTLGWIPPKERRIKKEPIKNFLTRISGSATPDQVGQLIKAVRQSPILVDRPRSEITQFDLGQFVANAVQSTNPAVEEFFVAQFEEETAKTSSQLVSPAGDKIRNTIPPSVLAALTELSNGANPQVKAAEYIAAAKVADMRNEMLFSIGLSQLRDLSFDVFVQLRLDQKREETACMDEPHVNAELTRLLNRNYQMLKQLLNTPLETRREELSWIQARNAARTQLIALAEGQTTTQELEHYLTHKRQEKRLSQSLNPEPERIPELVLPDGRRRPMSDFFDEGFVTSFNASNWCELPLRPAVTPLPPKEFMTLSIPDRAAVIFDDVLFSSIVCDRQGTVVGMSEATRAAHIEKVATAMRQGIPIEASEYTPLIAIGNPLKRSTQQVAMAEIDFIRRLAEISKAVETLYPPGLHWSVINEVPAFNHSAMLNIDPGYIDQFHEAMRDIAQRIDPEGRFISVLRLDDLLWGTPRRRDAWRSYYQKTWTDVQKALNDPTHPQHAVVSGEINTFIYPMSTCTNPYQFEAAGRLPIDKIVEAYGEVKRRTGSVIRGVGLTAENGNGLHPINTDQQALVEQLLERGRQMALIYRITMNARSVLPTFETAFPKHTVAYTMVTKQEKPVLYPNSGRGPYFPAHGEPVMIKQANPKLQQRTTVTVRPWWLIAANADRYIPVYERTDSDEPLYFEERP
ncbi:hypothetical protein HY358_01150 [Candidatus Roizmanbacteria bacterium]|nr:hypothetical protein [Candidatus Roizmanbacteria bacterium]